MSSRSSRPVDQSLGFICLSQSGIEWAMSPLHLFMVLEHLISTNSFCQVSLEQLACTLWPSEFLTYLSLPLPVYALLSGLNAATVGVVTFAAVQLATKAITDPLSRLIVVFSACTGLCYNALWYFPVLMIGGGISTAVWDLWARDFVGNLKIRWRREKTEGTGGKFEIDWCNFTAS